tara:strand:- start:3469 stop:6396 length:2928 start_codon:yes stop_codon:yes gene_type:complete
MSQKLGYAITTEEEMFRALKDLNKEGLTTAEMEDLVGKRAISAFSNMMEFAESSEYLTQQITGTNRAAEMAEEQMDNLEGDLLKLTSASEGFAIEMYDSMEPALRSVTQSMTEFIDAIDPQHIYNMITAIGILGVSFLAAKAGAALMGMSFATMGASALAAGASIKAFALSTGGVTIAITAVIGVIMAMGGAFEDTSNSTRNFSAELDAAFTAGATSFQKFGSTGRQVSIDFEKINSNTLATINSLSTLDIKGKEDRLKKMQEVYDAQTEELKQLNLLDKNISAYADNASTSMNLLKTGIEGLDGSYSGSEQATLSLVNTNINAFKRWDKQNNLTYEQIHGLIDLMEGLSTSLDPVSESISSNELTWGGTMKAATWYYTQADIGVTAAVANMETFQKGVEKNLMLDKDVFVKGADASAFASKASIVTTEYLREMELTARNLARYGDEVQTNTAYSFIGGGYQSQAENSHKMIVHIGEAVRQATNNMDPDAFREFLGGFADGDPESINKFLRTYAKRIEDLDVSTVQYNSDIDALAEDIEHARDVESQWAAFKQGMTDVINDSSEAVIRERNELSTATIVTVAAKQGLDEMNMSMVQNVSELAQLTDATGEYIYTEGQLQSIVMESVLASQNLTLAQAVLAKHRRDAITVSTDEEIAITQKLIALEKERKGFELSQESVETHVQAIKDLIESGVEMEDAIFQATGLLTDKTIEENDKQAELREAEKEERLQYLMDLAEMNGTYTDKQLELLDKELDAKMNALILEAEAEGFNAATILKIREDYTKKKKALRGEEEKADKFWADSAKGNMDIVLNSLAAYGQAAGVNSVDMVNLQIAQALSSAYSAASTAYAQAGGWPTGIIPAALSMSAQMGQVQALKAQKKQIQKEAAAAAQVSAEYGANFITNGPTNLLVGDNPGGREQVSVTPITSPNMRGGGAPSSGININISGNVMSKDFVENELIDTLNEAIRQGHVIES